MVKGLSYWGRGADTSKLIFGTARYTKHLGSKVQVESPWTGNSFISLVSNLLVHGQHLSWRSCLPLLLACSGFHKIDTLSKWQLPTSNTSVWNQLAIKTRSTSTSKIHALTCSIAFLSNDQPAGPEQTSAPYFPLSCHCPFSAYQK